MKVFCKYAVAPSEAYITDGRGGPLQRVEAPERTLCTWAAYHPAAAEKLSDTPPWLQLNALAGHLMREGDCERCPCFERGEPTE